MQRSGACAAKSGKAHLGGASHTIFRVTMLRALAGCSSAARSGVRVIIRRQENRQGFRYPVLRHYIGGKNHAPALFCNAQQCPAPMRAFLSQLGKLDGGLKVALHLGYGTPRAGERMALFGSDAHQVAAREPSGCAQQPMRSARDRPSTAGPCKAAWRLSAPKKAGLAHHLVAQDPPSPASPSIRHRPARPR